MPSVKQKKVIVSAAQQLAFLPSLSFAMNSLTQPFRSPSALMQFNHRLAALLLLWLTTALVLCLPAQLAGASPLPTSAMGAEATLALFCLLIRVA